MLINFISKKKINKILQIYGGYRKYQLNEKYTSNRKYEVVFTEKKDSSKWLVLRRINEKHIEVTATNDKGLIVARDLYEYSESEQKFHSTDKILKVS